MLRVKIEIVPYGREEDRYQIEEINIANVGGDNYKANYKVFVDKDPRFTGLEECDIIIKKFKRQKGARELVRSVLNKLYAKGNKNE
jgi:hypothetical protein